MRDLTLCIDKVCVSEWTALSDCLLGVRIAGGELREES